MRWQTKVWWASLCGTCLIIPAPTFMVMGEIVLATIFGVGGLLIWGAVLLYAKSHQRY